MPKVGSPSSSSAGSPRPPSSRIRVPERGGLEVNGRRGANALVELAREVDRGRHPLRELSAAARERLFGLLTTALEREGVLLEQRSAALTGLVALAGETSGDLRTRTVAAVLDGVRKERHASLRQVSVENLAALGLRLPANQAEALEALRARALPPSPPYEEWFCGGRNRLNVRHYVMDEFLRAELANYRRLGFEKAAEEGNRIRLVKEMKDPSGQNPPVLFNVVVVKGHDAMLRDVDDRKVHMVVYSGHSQLGKVLDASLANAPRSSGTKLLQFLSCRGKQLLGEVAARFPKAHVISTSASAYQEDDLRVLAETFRNIAARGSYQDLRKRLRRLDMLQPSTIYLLPDDPRSFHARDSDGDGRKDRSPLGRDHFYDPARPAREGGVVDFRPRTPPASPERLSGAKVDHAVDFANTLYFYFSEENPASPLTLPETDSFVSRGWFRGPANEPVRVAEHRREGRTYYEVSVNSRYAEQNRHAVTALVLAELQRHLASKQGRSFSEADRIRGLFLVTYYAELYVDGLEDCQRLVGEAARLLGLRGASFELFDRAWRREKHDQMGSRAVVEFLKKHGVHAE